MISSVISESILGRADKKKLVGFYTKNLFDFADPPHHRIDDYPFGGGAGMILKPEPVFRAYDEVIKELPENLKPRVIFPTPDGIVFNHNIAIDILLPCVFAFLSTGIAFLYLGYSLHLMLVA